MARTHYGPEEAYRKSVRPLAVFLVFVGVVFLLASVLLPVGDIVLPPVEKPLAKRLTLATVAVLSGLIGIGLYRRSRVAWYGLFAFIALGTVFAATSWVHMTSSYLVPLTGIAINVVVGVGIYFATRPAFSLVSKHDQPPTTDERQSRASPDQPDG